MKKNINVIQIKGFRGILYLAFIGICLAAGFGWFPGWLCMKIWNLISMHLYQMPQIGIIQGMLLWGIMAIAYYTFRKNKLVVCMKASEGLTEEELKAVFENIKQQAVDNDVFLKNMMKAHEAELKIKDLTETELPRKEVSDDIKEKMEIK